MRELNVTTRSQSNNHVTFTSITDGKTIAHM